MVSPPTTGEKKNVVYRKKMGSKPEYIEANREIINEKRRNRYCSELRKEDYHQNREQILKKCRDDRMDCPLCGLEFRRLYIPKHIATRHNKKRSLPEEDTDNLSVHMYGSV